jgi:cytochrome b
MSHEVKVWDPLVRTFHWSLVLFFVIAYLSGEDESDIHIYSSYVVLGLITFRVFWGIIGTKYARFSDFIHTPKYVYRYFKGLLTGSAQRYLGHNPLGGVMVVTLLISLFMVSFSGLKLYAVEEGLGPLAEGNNITLMSSAYADSDEKYKDNEHDQAEEFWEEIHEFFANFTLLLIILHIAGVYVSGYLHKENLVKAMITGRKKQE